MLEFIYFSILGKTLQISEALKLSALILCHILHKIAKTNDKLGRRHQKKAIQVNTAAWALYTIHLN